MTTSRENHQRGGLSDSLENYLETIYMVIRDRKRVRPKDLVERMGVRGASVTGALRALNKRELIEYRPYGEIVLTGEGERIAKEVIKRHETLRMFLNRILGIAPATADREACRLEHSVSRDVLDRLVVLANYLESCPRAKISSVPEAVKNIMPSPECDVCQRPPIKYESKEEVAK